MGSEKQSSQIFDNLLFPKIFQTFRIAIQPSKLIIAFLALIIICLAGWIMDFSKSVVVVKDNQNRIVNTELQTYLSNPDQLPMYIKMYQGKGAQRGVFSTFWDFTAEKFKGTVTALLTLNIPVIAANAVDCFKSVGWAVRYHLVYCIIFFVIKLIVISIAGGAICRITALQFAQGEKPGMAEALRYSMKRFKSFFAAPLAPVGIVVIVGLIVFVVGVIGNIPVVGELIVAVLVPLTLVAGALIAVVTIGTVAGFNLMFPAIAYDGSDCFDAISRSFSYVYAKPWRMGFYSVIAAVYGAICYMFVRFFALLILWSGRWFLQFGIWAKNAKEVNKLAAIWPEPSFANLLGLAGAASGNWSESIAIFLVHLFSLIVVSLVVVFLISFYFSANTIIYALMRKTVDNTALEDIYTSLNGAKAEAAEIEAAAGETQPQTESKPQADG